MYTSMISVAFNLQSTQGAKSVGPTMFPMVMQTMIFDKFFKKLSLNEVYMSGTILASIAQISKKTNEN